MTPSRFGPIVAGLIVGLAGPTAAAQPQEPSGATEAASDPAAREEARTLFERGTRLMENENWEMALVELRRSFERYPTRSALFNLAMCEKALHQYRAALAHFDDWQARYGSSAPEAEREAVSAAQTELREYVGFLLVESDPAGAAVRVDGENAGTTPFARPVPLDIGRHEVEVSVEGYVVSSREVVVAPLDTLRVAVTLEPVPDEPVPDDPVGVGVAPGTDPTTGTPDEERLDALWFLTTAAVAVAAGIGGGVAGGMALSQETDLADYRDRCAAGDPTACNDGRAALADYDDTRLAANVLFGVAGAFAVTAVVLAFFTDFDFGGDEAPRVDVSAGAIAGPTGAIDGFGLGARGRF
jgi:hypothetical protein